MEIVRLNFPLEFLEIEPDGVVHTQISDRWRDYIENRFVLKGGQTFFLILIQQQVFFLAQGPIGLLPWLRNNYTLIREGPISSHDKNQFIIRTEHGNDKLENGAQGRRARERGKRKSASSVIKNFLWENLRALDMCGLN